jgi:predicted ArsR family transcriptional regulator
VPVAPGSPALSPTDFSSAVTAITSAFGDPTRRRIYLLAHERADGVTAAEVAEVCDLHPNVARHHLDKLAGGGHLEVSVDRGRGSGRPSKRYRATAEQVELDVPVRHDEILLALLGAALTELGPERAEVVAETVGEHYGRAMAGRMDEVGDAPRSVRAALHAAADALSAHGFAAHAEDTRGALRIVSEHCPFGDAAVEHPVICAVDRGMVRGLLATLTDDAGTRAETEASLARGDQVCITSLTGELTG